jgi:hypothetical protein
MNKNVSYFFLPQRRKGAKKINLENLFSASPRLRG